MPIMDERRRPGEIRDAIVGFLAARGGAASVAEIRAAVATKIKAMAPSSVRSYLRLNTGTIFERTGHGSYLLTGENDGGVAVAEAIATAPAVMEPVYSHGKCKL